MKEISVTINGKKINTLQGKTILEVVHEHTNEHIPTLCHDDRIEPYGSCFLCVVEVEGLNRLLPSCCTPIAGGMAIHTDNQRIRDSRKTALELLLSNHYADCTGPCTNNCPAQVDAQGYIALMSRGMYRGALRLIKGQNPLPLSIGRVCVRDCETACRRGIVDEPVGINHLKRYAADLDAPDKWVPAIKAKKGKKVAVVGAGPSGLTCAYFLTIEGYDVTIFEKNDRPGGMLMYGIPEYRLPKKVLEDEIQWILDLGVRLETGSRMGRDFTLESLKADGFASVYLAVGAHRASIMRLEHEDETGGILKGIDFLAQLPHRIPRLEGHVVVVGGGNTAIDAARTALRCGADNVTIVYRRGLDQMPAHEDEIHAARDEGIQIELLTNPKTILRDNNRRLTGLVCLKMELEPGKPGERPRPVPIEGSEFEIACDFLIGAIGQQVDTGFAQQEKQLTLERWGTIHVDPATQATSLEGVFAGGDAVTGPDTAVNAIGQGKRAAHAIDTYLETGRPEAQAKPFLSFKHTFAPVSEQELEHIPLVQRNLMPHLPAHRRAMDFREVETGYTCDQASQEPARCIECGCSEYSDCRLRLAADEYQVDITPYIGETRKYIPDTRHPFIRLDPNKCINCGRCVRTCAEVLKVSALGFVNRGFRAVVKPAMEKALAETNCVACGNCIDTCPTGAITQRLPFKALGTLPRENRAAICTFCSIGCHVNFKVLQEELYYVDNSPGSGITGAHNLGYLCARGRFGHRYLLDTPRLTTPMVRKMGTQEHVTWKTAVDTTVNGIKDVIDRYGIDAVAVTVSPCLSNEELYLLQKFTRVGLKTNNIDSFSRMLYGSRAGRLDDSLGATVSTASLEDIAGADTVVLINGGLSEDNLLMELKIKAACKNNNTKLVLVNSSEIKVTKFADLWIDSRKGTNTLLLNGLIRELLQNGAAAPGVSLFDGFDKLEEMTAPCTEEKVTRETGIAAGKYRRLVQLLQGPDKKTIFVYNPDAPGEQSLHDLEAIGNLLLLTGRTHGRGSGLILLREYGNSTGIEEMGALPHYLPGQVKPHEKDEINRIGAAWKTPLEKIFQPVDLAEKLSKGEIKALLVFGEDPLAVAENERYLKDIEFLLVQDLTLTATAAAAQVVLPAAAPIEQEGSYIACDRRVQHSQTVVPGVTEGQNHQAISRLAKAFGMPVPYRGTGDISREIASINRFYNGHRHNPAFFLENPLQKGWPTPSGKPRFLTYDIDTAVPVPAYPSVLFTERYYRDRIKSRLTAR